nr:response regulator [Luteibacter yeojuensis]
MHVPRTAFADRHTVIDLLLTDIGMPGMDGRELAEAARAWRPALPVLFMTGYAENAMERSRFLGQGTDMIAKPFEIDVLLARIRGMLD